MKITFEKILIVGLALAVLFFINRCHNDSIEAKAQQIKLDSLSLANQKRDSIYNERGQKVIEQQVIITHNQEEIRRLADEAFALKKQHAKQIKDIIAFYSEHTNIHLDSAFIPYIDTVAQKHFNDSLTAACAEVIAYYKDSTIIVPRTAKDSTQYYNANLTATLAGININNISLPDQQSIQFTTIKGGFLKRDINGKRRLFLRRSVWVQVLHSNPNIAVTGQISALYQPVPKVHWLGKALLIGAGVFLGTKL